MSNITVHQTRTKDKRGWFTMSEKKLVRICWYHGSSDAASFVRETKRFSQGLIHYKKTISFCARVMTRV